MKYGFRIFLLFACLAGWWHPAQAQQPAVKLKTQQLPDSAGHQTTLKQDNTIPFKNLNKLPFFEDKKALAKIRRAERRKDVKALLPLLESYVGNFGIENFYRDTRLLWRLAQVNEGVGNLDRAKMYYNLVLKHHRMDIKQVRQYYDSLTKDDQENYVALDYYYELLEFRKNVVLFRPPKGINIKLGFEVNSKYADYAPSLSEGDSVMIFSSVRKFRGVENLPDEDLYYSKKVDGWWEEAKPFKKPIQSIFNEGSARLSKDGRTLFFARCHCPDCHHNCDLYTATLINDSTWARVKNMGPLVNSPGWDSQPTLSPNEDTLYFASDRLGGFGLSDIYYSVKQKNGTWGKAMNMGPVINTRDNDVSPFYHPKYGVLYFSSRGQLLNYGDYDIYKSYRVKGQWQEPRSVGPLVNGKGSEYYFTIDSQSENLYYAKSEESELKNLDLYSFPLPMEAHPLAVTRIEGQLLDSLTQKPLQGIVSIIDLTNGIEVASKYIRPDGTFDFDLIDQSKYMMIIQSPDYFTVEQELDLKSDTVFKVMTSLIDYSIPLVFRNIEFDEGKSVIKEEMHPILDRIVLFLADHPTFTLEISGHTDSSGDEDTNLELSQARANAIRTYLVQKGKFKAARITAIGFGSMRQLRDEETEEDRRINRRVEFKLQKPEK